MLMHVSVNGFNMLPYLHFMHSFDGLYYWHGSLLAGNTMMFLLSTRALAGVAGLVEGVGFWVLSTVWLGLSSKGVKALALRFEAGASNTSWFSGDSFLTRSAEYRVMLG